MDSNSNQNVEVISSQSESYNDGITRLTKETKNLELSIDNLRKELNDSKKDYIVFLGIFATIIAYLTIQIRVLESVNNFHLLIGLSSFILFGLLLFNLCLNYLVKQNSTWWDFINPVFIMTILLGLFSVYCFYSYSKDKVEKSSYTQEKIITQGTNTQQQKEKKATKFRDSGAT